MVLLTEREAKAIDSALSQLHEAGISFEKVQQRLRTLRSEALDAREAKLSSLIIPHDAANIVMNALGWFSSAKLAMVSSAWSRAVVSWRSFLTAIHSAVDLPHLTYNGYDTHDEEKMVATFQALAKYCPLLQLLDLEGCSWVTGGTLKIVARSCSSLRHLNLKNCGCIDDLGILTLFWEGLPLRWLNVSGNDTITDEAISMITETCPDLEHISMCCEKVSEDACLTLSRCHGLRHLEASVSDASVQALAPALPMLQYFSCGGISDTGLHALAYHCRELMILKLCHQDISDSGLQALGKSCHKLTVLTLKGCESIGDAGLKALAKNCFKLKCLNVGGCSAITDIGVQALASSCLQLQHFNLWNCDLITDASIDTLARHCSLLKHLEMGCCFNITSAAMLELVSACPRLQYLNTMNCRNVDPVAQQEIAAILARRGNRRRPRKRSSLFGLPDSDEDCSAY